MPKVKLSITVVDKNIDSFVDNLVYYCPEIYFKSTLNNETEYDINLIGADAVSKEFVDQLNGEKQYNYIIAALGNDELNIQTAIKIRSLIGAIPSINVIVQNKSKVDITNILCTEKNQSNYDIEIIGDISTLYTYKNLLHSKFELIGQYVNYVYCDCLYSEINTKKSAQKSADRNFFWDEYSKRSSISTGIHLNYKLFSVFGDNKKFEEYSIDQKIKLFSEYISIEKNYENLCKYEHLRWNAYMRVNGYTCADINEFKKYANEINNHVNYLRRKHPCLVSWEELSEVSNFVNAVLNKNSDFKKEDAKIIDNLCNIINEQNF